MPDGSLTGFDTYYSDHPWSGMTTNQRAWYVPDLLSAFRARSVYRPFVPQTVDLAAERTGTMYFTLLYDLEPDITALDNRDLWLTSMHWDTARIAITMEHHGGKVAYHKYDDMITFWRQNNVEGLRRICRGALGQSMTDHLDLLARNAFLTAPFCFYADQTTATGFSQVTESNLFNLSDIMKVWLGLSYREVPLAQGASGAGGSMIVITTPGVIYDVQDEAGGDWQAVNSYSEAGRSSILKYEVGAYKNARFIQTTKNTLFNCGTVSKQVTITSSTAEGVGAAATVDTAYSVGQSGATAYVQCSAFSAGEFDVGDIVTIHTDRTTGLTGDKGVPNGVDWTGGKTCTRRVVTVDADNNRLSFDKPLLHAYTTDLGGGVYGYVTKGIHIHASVCIAGPSGVVAGVGQPPAVYNPPQVEDIPSMHRFSWDAYLKYQLFRPEMFEVVYSAGNVRVIGDVRTS